VIFVVGLALLLLYRLGNSVMPYETGLIRSIMAAFQNT
jgi:hypothetical protein